MKPHHNALPSPKKPPHSGMDKVFPTTLTQVLPSNQQHSLVAWVRLYYQVYVAGSSPKTEKAKQADLQKFLVFFRREVGHEHVDQWTPAITKHFQQQLQKTLSPATQQPYKATTINRIIATLRHFGTWLHKQRPLLAGHPLHGVKDIQTDDPDWNGLTPRQVMRLKAACEQRMAACQRADQNPRLETAVFYVLLQTGLRESELVTLNVHQYHHRGLHDVLRHKNKRISKKVPLPTEARDFLDRYLATRNPQSEEPLFTSRYGQRLAAQDVHRLCSRLLKQASTYLDEGEKFRFTPHMLRHTFLKRVTDKGLCGRTAKNRDFRLSGNSYLILF